VSLFPLGCCQGGLSLIEPRSNFRQPVGIHSEHIAHVFLGCENLREGKRGFREGREGIRRNRKRDMRKRNGGRKAQHGATERLDQWIEVGWRALESLFLPFHGT